MSRKGCILSGLLLVIVASGVHAAPVMASRGATVTFTGHVLSGSCDVYLAGGHVYLLGRMPVRPKSGPPVTVQFSGCDGRRAPTLPAYLVVESPSTPHHARLWGEKNAADAGIALMAANGRHSVALTPADNVLVLDRTLRPVSSDGHVLSPVTLQGYLRGAEGKRSVYVRAAFIISAVYG